MDVAVDIAGVGRPVVFGFLQLDNMGGGQAAEVLEELKRNLTDKMIADLPLLHGRVSLVENMIVMLHGRVFLIENMISMLHGRVFLVENMIFMLHGRVFLVENMIFMLHGRVFLVQNCLPGFVMNTLGVLEKNTVVRLAIQVENLDTLLELNRFL